MKQKIKNTIIILIFMIIFTLSLVFYSTLKPFFFNLFADKFNIVSTKDNLLVHFIDVGQADASAINLPDGKVLLIDTGDKEVNTTYINYLKENVTNTKRGNYIDYLVLTHADMDHIGGTMKLIKNFEIGTIYIPKVDTDSQGYKEISQNLPKNSKIIKLGEEFIIKNENYKIKFFKILNSTNQNDSSQIIKIEYNNKIFLFVGDISASIEDDYVEIYGKELDADVLKVSHHGSNTASSELFLNCVTPKYAVISVGYGNDYGHPTFDVLQRLNEVGAKVFRTDDDSNILFAHGYSYNLKVLTNIYYIVNVPLDYSIYVVALDSVLLVIIAVIFLKKDKNKQHHK